MTKEMDIGVAGLGVMGRNLALNIADKGFSLAVYNRHPDPVKEFAAAAGDKPVAACKTVEEFTRALKRPRRILMLVKAGVGVENTIAALKPHLEKGDILVDAGNEHFSVTERRERELSEAGIRYFGMGVSGGESGARHGPSMMPGGERAAYEELAPILTKIAAQHPDGPCVAYMGPGGAGHYVKMIHNGIEYGDMQLIAEAYDVLKNIGGLSNEELAETFSTWNQGELESYLVQITAHIFTVKDPEGQGQLLDAILDASSMKGTGTWTVQDAATLTAAIPTVASAVDARVLSSDKQGRVRISKVLPGPDPAKAAAVAQARGIDRKALVAAVRDALYASKLCSYAQGMNLLRLASIERKWDLDLPEIARIWQDGCIIRARLLSRIKAAFASDPQLPNLLLDPSLVEDLRGRQEGWRKVVSLAAEAGLPTLATSASLSYYDTIRRERLPANLIQAQRDFFGAHTYKRLDRDGDLHTEWSAGS
ncbi:NADP-dependent phosphogluconate dehydrogenase [Chondromyces apiculatus]|uniref:6-phosphogluconate dehydrogenase, decarboxylating n=1 Tax=Chondromyces apiculatus DSM 436 TaxID=1192034 RepID=A0A017TG61_9BACT|nr:NADP-dependent phosphogluconate dehydrogenase [Chondromyces apiculatus]EYF07546.1 6-phosphogluconate dehydrogenase, decarboxylating [Chondromyces apiculatus DSM 436]